jgi:hypothetical protein
MKKLKSFQIAFLLISLAISSLFNLSCSDNNNEETIMESVDKLSNEDKEALLFMLEEEKLARDTYDYLDNKWGIKQFTNIKKSEQSHMNAIINLLDQYSIAYTVLPYGSFEDETLQNYYSQFVESGQISQANALQIGATIEDLDIVDLQEYIDNTTNLDIISVFESLKCGSRNHLRSFVSAIMNIGDTYTNQFLTQEDYNLIISSNNEQCNF